MVLAFEQENSGGHQKGREGRSGAGGAEGGPGGGRLIRVWSKDPVVGVDGMLPHRDSQISGRGGGGDAEADGCRQL